MTLFRCCFGDAGPLDTNQLISLFLIVNEMKLSFMYFFKYIRIFCMIHCILMYVYVQSTLVISNSKGLSEILRDIRSSTYQVCRIEEKII